MAAAGAHPSIARYHGAWMEQKAAGEHHVYIQLEMCGMSLGSRMAVHSSPLKEADLLDVLAQVHPLNVCMLTGCRLPLPVLVTQSDTLLLQHSCCNAPPCGKASAILRIERAGIFLEKHKFCFIRSAHIL